MNYLDKTTWIKPPFSVCERNFSNNLPARHGAPWNLAELNALRVAVGRIPHIQIARRHERTERATRLRIPEALLTANLHPESDNMASKRTYTVSLTRSQLDDLQALVRVGQNALTGAPRPQISAEISLKWATGSAQCVAALNRAYRVGSDVK